VNAVVTKYFLTWPEKVTEKSENFIVKFKWKLCISFINFISTTGHHYFCCYKNSFSLLDNIVHMSITDVRNITVACTGKLYYSRHKKLTAAD